MRIAIVAAGFTPGEADQLRRAMATFRHVGTIHTFQTKLIEGMVKNGYPREFAERCFEQIRGFGEYGFPESHAASFALLVYVSAWIKCHYPAAFAAALLNSQPMGFYAPAQIVRDAREHGVEVRAGRRQSQRLGLHAGARACRADRAAPGLSRGEGVARDGHAAVGGTARHGLCHVARSLAARADPAARIGNTRQCRCVELAGSHTARGAVANPGPGRRPAAALCRGTDRP